MDPFGLIAGLEKTPLNPCGEEIVVKDEPGESPGAAPFNLAMFCTNPGTPLNAPCCPPAKLAVKLDCPLSPTPPGRKTE